MPLFLFRATRHIEHLEDRLDTLEHAFKRLELDWSTVYEKVTKNMRRTMLERAKLEAKEEGTDGAGATPEGSPAPTTHGRLLTPRQLEIQQQVLKRRAGA